VDVVEQPLVSVVIPCVNGLPVVAECVECLLKVEGGVPVEVLVADRTGEATRSVLRERFPQVEVIAAEGSTSIPALRAAALERVQGQMVAILEDHCLVQPGWLKAVVRAYQAGHQVVSGPVENGCLQRAVDWAAFFCEYTRFMGPVPDGIVTEVAGNNSAYDRRLFEQLRPELEAEAWESAWHVRLRELGVTLYSDPEMVVLHKKSFGYGYFASQRYHYSRSFAGMRLRAAPVWKRGLYALATSLLPGVLLCRIVSAVLRKGRHGREFLRSLPVLATFLVVWAVGEAVGALLGPGDSLQRVE